MLLVAIIIVGETVVQGCDRKGAHAVGLVLVTAGVELAVTT